MIFSLPGKGGDVLKTVASPFTLGTDTLARKALGPSGKQLTPITSAVDKGLGIKTPSPGLPPLDTPPAPVTREDPAIADRKRKARLASLQRRGRGSTIIAGALGEAPVNRPGKLGETV